MKKLIGFIKSVFQKKEYIAQCYECGKKFTRDDEFIIDHFFTTEARRLNNAFSSYRLKDTYCVACRDFLIEGNKIVGKEW